MNVVNEFTFLEKKFAYSNVLIHLVVKRVAVKVIYKNLQVVENRKILC